MFNEEAITACALNTKHAHSSRQDEMILEQLYQFQNCRDEILTGSTTNAA